jgi:hypothetical protein
MCRVSTQITGNPALLARLGVVAAQLGHADTRMTEKHYAHLAPSYVAQAIRANFPVLGLTDGAVVVPLRRKKAS